MFAAASQGLHNVRFTQAPLNCTAPRAGAAGRRQRAVLSLLTACRESEPRYLTRTLVQVGAGRGWRSCGPAPCSRFCQEGACAFCRFGFWTSHFSEQVTCPIVHWLVQALRVGANWRSVLPALAKAVVVHKEGAKVPKASTVAAVLGKQLCGTSKGGQEPPTAAQPAHCKGPTVVRVEHTCFSLPKT